MSLCVAGDIAITPSDTRLVYSMEAPRMNFLITKKTEFQTDNIVFLSEHLLLTTIGHYCTVL